MFDTIMGTNFILAGDSYKQGHIFQGAKGTLRKHVNMVARKPFVDEKHGISINEIVVLGPQVVATILENTRITDDMINEAEKEITEQGYDFPRAEWEYLRDLGRLPLVVKAVPEGTVVPVGHAIMTVENVDDRSPWLPAYIETWSQDIVWTMSTIASKVRYLYKQTIAFCEETGTPVEAAEYMIHNFGDRGAGGQDRAIMAGIAHALFFSGSDTLRANRYIKNIYYAQGPVLSSVDANEHSTVCENSDCENRNDYNAFLMSLGMLERAVARANRGVGIPLISALIDTFDDERYVKEFVIKNYSRICSIGGKYVCRPDSGDAVKKPIEVVKWLMKGLRDKVRTSTTGHWMLPDNIGVIQGDGLKLWDFQRIFDLAKQEGIAASNLVFGFGGGMTNGSTRDDFSFSMKATACMGPDRKWRDLQKVPKTDPGKTSLKGRITDCNGKTLVPIYGSLMDLRSEFTDIRKRARA